MTVTIHWEQEPRLPLRFERGVFHPSGKPMPFQHDEDLDLADAVSMFGDNLPPQPNSWAYVADAAENRIIGYAWQDQTLYWIGCQTAFNELRAQRPTMATDITFWAILAEHEELQPG